jgi:cell division protein FtsB
VKAAAARSVRGRAPQRGGVARPASARGGRAGVVLRTLRGLQLRRLGAMFAVLLVLAMAKVWIGLQVVATGYELETLAREQLRLEEFRQQLEVELATKQSRAVLEERARRTLGMVTPKRGQVVDVR